MGPGIDVLAASTGPRLRWSSAKTPATVLERARWPELERALDDGARTAILPLGSIEQHGPHLPFGTDRFIADALAEALAERVGDAVALPAIPFGCASEHLDFAGTLHVEPDTLERLLGDLLGSVARHGFARAFVFTAHGGNVDALRAMRDRLGRRARPLALAVADDLDVGRVQAAVVEGFGLGARTAGPHAGEYETSVVAWLVEGGVRPGALAPGTLVPGRVAPSFFYPSLRSNAPNGVAGDPTRAARERGAAYLAAWVDALEAAYRDAFDVAGAAAKKRK
jgi:creatinine amidohydrolase